MGRLERILADLFGMVFVVLAVVVGVETLARKIFNFSIQGADELGGYALAVGSTIGFALAVVGRNHIRVDIVHERLPRILQALLNWLSAVLLAGLALLFVYACWIILVETVEFGSEAQTPWATPLIIPQTVWYAGLVLFALFALYAAIRACRLLFSGHIDELNEAFHPKSAKEELQEELEDLSHRSAAGGSRP